MKRFSLAIAAIIAFQASSVSAQIEPNSTYFRVEKYYYPHANGDWLPYQAAGFAQAPAPNVQPIIFMFPTITVQHDDIKFYSDTGQSFDPRDFPSRQVALISFTPKYVATLPKATQIPAIAATLANGTAIDRFFPPAARSNGFPVMT